VPTPGPGRRRGGDSNQVQPEGRVTAMAAPAGVGAMAVPVPSEADAGRRCPAGARAGGTRSLAGWQRQAATGTVSESELVAALALALAA